MTIAHVVPIRRLPPDRDWFDYSIPAELTDLQVGHIVNIPFQRQTIQGIVWSIDDTSTAATVKPILSIVRPEPIITPWQRQAIIAAAEIGCVSIAYILQSIIPTFPRPTKPRDTPIERINNVAPQKPPDGSTWWYTRRQDTQAWIRYWLEHQPSPNRQKLLLIPVIEDGLDILHSAPSPEKTVLVHAKLSAGAYSRMYQGVLSGAITTVIGTAKALFLPFVAEPEILVDQEEHPAHKQTALHPRLDTRRLLGDLGVQLQATTPAPSLWWWTRFHPTPPTNSEPRTLASLDRPNPHPWVSQEFEDTLQSTLARGQNILVISPHRGFAQSIVCADCGYTLACVSCGQRLALQQKSDHRLRCRFCQHQQDLPEACPQCQGVKWQWRGLGTEQVQSSLSTYGPAEIIGEDGRVPKSPIIIATYQGYRQAPEIPKLSAVVVIHGDALLNIPDYSTEERAWQYLARLAATVPGTPLMVQTYQPQSDFWQRWLSNDHVAWYQNAITQRQRLHLPPAVEQWIAIYPGPDGQLAVEDMQNELTKRRIPGMTTEILPSRQETQQRQSSARLLITNRADHPLRQDLNWRTLFPTPWQVDTTPASWM